MLNIRIADALAFKRVVDALVLVVKNVELVCDRTELSLYAMDPSHVSLAEFSLTVEDLNENEDGVRADVCLAALAKILRCTCVGDALFLATTEPGHLDIRVVGPAREANFQLKFAPSDGEVRPCYQRGQDIAEIVMNADLFSKTCRDLESFSEDVYVTCESNALTLSTPAENQIVARVRFPHADTRPIDKQMFCAKRLYAMSRASACSDSVLLTLEDAAPLCKTNIVCATR